MELNEQGVKAPAGRTPRPMPEMPPELAAALAMRKHARARKAFDAFAPSHRREYIEWIAGARGEDTRARRLAQALERSEEHTSELQSLMRISYAVLCLNKHKHPQPHSHRPYPSYS